MRFFIIKKEHIKYIITAFAGILFLLIIISAVPDSVHTLSTGICRNNEDRINFLRSFGWEVSEEPFEIKTIIIPTEFNTLYENYNSLQKTQGYNLEDFKGQTVKRWTYTVQNYPQGGIAYADIYIYENKIIAADIYTPGIDGIMHGLMYPNVKSG